MSKSRFSWFRDRGRGCRCSCGGSALQPARPDGRSFIYMARHSRPAYPSLTDSMAGPGAMSCAMPVSASGHTLGHIRARDLIAFSAAIVAPMKPFLGKNGHSQEIVNRMYDAWWKSMILQVTLWSQPYIQEGDF